MCKEATAFPLFDCDGCPRNCLSKNAVEIVKILQIATKVKNLPNKSDSEVCADRIPLDTLVVHNWDETKTYEHMLLPLPLGWPSLTKRSMVPGIWIVTMTTLRKLK